MVDISRKVKKPPTSKKKAVYKLKGRQLLERVERNKKKSSAILSYAKTQAEAIQMATNMASEPWLIFEGVSDKPEGQMTPMEKMVLVDQRITKKDLESLKEKTDLDYDELAQVLSVGRATLINKKGTDKFSAPLSEKIVGLADLYSYGYEVFEDKERFNQWMLRPNQALGGQAPYDLIHNQFGREEVKNVIGRIEYGVFS
jgi:putative toxin-antitoxin system antitoxin component (TIGR02293 family)